MSDITISRPEVVTGHTDVICSTSIRHILAVRKSTLLQIDTLIRQLADRLADLERMLYLFSGKPIPDNRENIIIRLDDHIRSVQGKACYEDEMFNIRYFKKGSAHITFRKPELVDRLNDIIARHYPEMLPSL
ncbi:DUF4942 domain-containing protein [Escherichia coli]|nr:DUF4942 domain-containing protein [Escherichia coli]ELK1684446.1 DUF4942 domain-containing protein [Escherichia coli]